MNNKIGIFHIENRKDYVLFRDYSYGEEVVC